MRSEHGLLAPLIALALCAPTRCLAQDLEDLRPGLRVRVLTTRPGVGRVEGRIAAVNPGRLIVRRGANEVTLPFDHPQVLQVEVEAGRRGLVPLVVAAALVGTAVGAELGWRVSRLPRCGGCAGPPGSVGMAVAAGAAGGLLGVGLSLQFGPRQWRVVFRKSEPPPAGS